MLFHKFKALFVLTLFALALFGEATEIISVNGNQELSASTSSIFCYSSPLARNVDDCKNESAHCSDHCGSLHHFAIPSAPLSISITLLNEILSINDFKLIYQSPFLNPSLKPPTLV